MTNEKILNMELIEKTHEWLGKDGIDFFKKIKNKYGQYNAVFTEGGIPHPVHFREGMQVRNFMRSTGLCEDFDDHDFDNNWTLLIEKVMELKGN